MADILKIDSVSKYNKLRGVKCKEDNNSGTISYSDDGKGFPADIQYGNGLNNTVNRIQALNGEIIFGKSDKGGASIAIRFPLQASKV
jgi:signal transduction histidine kinase